MRVSMTSQRKCFKIGLGITFEKIQAHKAEKICWPDDDFGNDIQTDVSRAGRRVTRHTDKMNKQDRNSDHGQAITTLLLNLHVPNATLLRSDY